MRHKINLSIILGFIVLTSAFAADPASSTTMGTIRHLKIQNNQLVWCSLNPQTYESQILETFGDVLATEPALWRDGRITIFTVKHATHPRLTGTVLGKPFNFKFPPNMDIEIRHPSVSRDGKLLAFTIKSSRHVGDVHVHNWDTGAYESTYLAVGNWYKIVSVNLETGAQQAIYHDDALVPDVMKKRGLGPVFSPKEDILVYADNYRIYVCNALTGANIRTWEVPQISSGGWTGQALISEYSGLAFHPDGQTVAYFSQGEADIAISPPWIVLFNIKDGTSTCFTLQDGISGGAPYGVITLDFSPSGQYLAFSAVTHDINAPILALLDVTTGETGYYNNLGACFHPVWKGR